MNEFFEHLWKLSFSWFLDVLCHIYVWLLEMRLYVKDCDWCTTFYTIYHVNIAGCNIQGVSFPFMWCICCSCCLKKIGFYPLGVKTLLFKSSMREIRELIQISTEFQWIFVLIERCSCLCSSLWVCLCLCFCICIQCFQWNVLQLRFVEKFQADHEFKTKIEDFIEINKECT